MGMILSFGSVRDWTLENSDLRRNRDGRCEELGWLVVVIGGGFFMSVTNLSKLAMARKQNFAGIVNGKRTGRM
jgi:hypothetical protein